MAIPSEQGRSFKEYFQINVDYRKEFNRRQKEGIDRRAGQAYWELEIYPLADESGVKHTKRLRQYVLSGTGYTPDKSNGEYDDGAHVRTRSGEYKRRTLEKKEEMKSYAK